MKQKFIFLFLPAVVALTSCFTNAPQNNSSTVTFYSSETTFLRNYEYSEISNRLILWDDIFFIPKKECYIYFFSKTCSHCERLKNIMIPVILNHEEFFACESARDHIIEMDAETHIGIPDIELTIRGYPTLIYIENKTIQMNIAGEKQITNFLTTNNIY